MASHWLSCWARKEIFLLQSKVVPTYRCVSASWGDSPIKVAPLSPFFQMGSNRLCVVVCEGSPFWPAYSILNVAFPLLSHKNEFSKLSISDLVSKDLKGKKKPRGQEIEGTSKRVVWSLFCSLFPHFPNSNPCLVLLHLTDTKWLAVLLLVASLLFMPVSLEISPRCMLSVPWIYLPNVPVDHSVAWGMLNGMVASWYFPLCLTLARE